MNENKDLFGKRIKDYERLSEYIIPADEHIIVRIDGHKFSKFTKGFNRPFDNILSNTMIETTKQLLTNFNAVVGYTQSDEITLIIPTNYIEQEIDIDYTMIEVDYDSIYEDQEYRIYDLGGNYVGTVETYYEPDENGYNSTTYYIYTDNNIIINECMEQDRNPQTVVKTNKFFSEYKVKRVDYINNQIFGGRTQKMSSLIASFATMTFNNILSEKVKYKLSKYSKLEYYMYVMSPRYNTLLSIDSKLGKAWFDCRVYGVPNKTEAFNSLLWRHHDCKKNSYSQFAHTYCTHKSLLNKTGIQQIEFCKDKTGNDWNLIEDKYKFGTIIKKQNYIKEATDTTKECIRTKLVEISKDLYYSDENVTFIMCKALDVKV